MTDKEELRQLRAAVKRKCRDCCCGMESEIKGCRIKSCPLWEFRTEQRVNTSERKLKGQISIFGLGRAES